MFWFLNDPGDCGICGAAHCSCTGANPNEVVLLPGRDASLALARAAAVAAPSTPPLVADRVQATLGPNEFTSGTYRRKRGRRQTS